MCSSLSVRREPPGSTATLTHTSDRAVSQLLERAVVELDRARQWRSWAWLTVLNSNVYLEHERKLEELDLAELLDAGD